MTDRTRPTSQRMYGVIFALRLSTLAYLCSGVAIANDGGEFFEKRVRPIFARYCYECHSAAQAAANGQLNLQTIPGILAGGSRGSLIDREQWKSSLLLKALKYETVDIEMPPEGKLSDAQIETVQTWLQRGAVLPQYSHDDSRKPAASTSHSQRPLWSLAPLRESIPPHTQVSSVATTPIDSFIVATLEQHNLNLSGRADRRVLIRRVTFDLTGLPPNPADVDAFLHDTHPDAYRRLVDRLLASPAYGERWARFWLDLARYTDTTASWLKGTGQAWLYRDWVVEAWNRNLSYRDFVSLQLAADMLDDVPPSDLAALGFLGLSPTYWKELKLAPNVIQEVVAEEWDERVDAVSRTFLGLTVSCARCHDHKFDPITAEDYYGLAGVFASTQLHDEPLLPPEMAIQYRRVHSEVARIEQQLKSAKEATQKDALQKELQTLKNSIPFFHAPTAHTVTESSVFVLPDGTDKTRLDYRPNQPRDLPVFYRGNPANPGDTPIPRSFPKALTKGTRQPFSRGSGRRELASAFFDHSEALTARVIVNRIWREHFGRGFVNTPSNFGQQGDRPTHPDLLDYLARQLVHHEWNLKWLQREIVLSATYQQSSAYRESANAVDPGNIYLWRMNRRRLTVEMWRDAMLTASGTLVRQFGGAPAALTGQGHHRRTLYSRIARRELDQMLRLYDFPEPTAHSPNREITTTPLQQLYMLNAQFMHDQARHLVHRTTPTHDSGAHSVRERVHTLYAYLFGRPATQAELTIAERFLSVSKDPTMDENSSRWAAYIQALFGTNEFIYID